MDTRNVTNVTLKRSMVKEEDIDLESVDRS